MVKSILAVAAILAFQSFTYAESNCQPTKTVEVANSELQSKQESRSAELNRKNQSIVELRAQSLAEALKSYNESVAKIEEAYADDLNSQNSKQSSEWRAGHAKIISLYNQANQLNATNYSKALSIIESTYDARIIQAKFEYSMAAKQARDDYNRSVCAQ